MDNKLKLTILSYEMLKYELEDAELLSQQYKERFFNEVYPDKFNNLFIDHNSSHLLNEDIQEIPEVSENLRKIYKKLTLKTHPDRNLNLNEEEQIENEEIFKEISESYQKGDFCNLLVKAKELRIKIPLLTLQDTEILNINIKNMEEKLNGIKKEISWKWCVSTCAIEKENIKQFIKKIIKETILMDLVIEEDKNCAICLDKMETGNVEKQLPCNHIFHKGCILSWFSVVFSCPLCRMLFE